MFEGFMLGIFASYAGIAFLVHWLRLFGWFPSGTPVLKAFAECAVCGILWPYVAFRLMVREFLA